MLGLVIALLATGVVAGTALVLWRARRNRDVDEMLLQLRIREILLADPSLAACPISVSILSKPVEVRKLRLVVARALTPAEHVAERRPT